MKNVVLFNHLDRLLTCSGEDCVALDTDDGAPTDLYINRHGATDTEADGTTTPVRSISLDLNGTTILFVDEDGEITLYDTAPEPTDRPIAIGDTVTINIGGVNPDPTPFEVRGVDGTSAWVRDTTVRGSTGFVFPIRHLTKKEF